MLFSNYFLPGKQPLSRQVLHGLQFKSHIYEGTVPDEEIARRRARNKMARRSRQINRRVRR